MGSLFFFTTAVNVTTVSLLFWLLTFAFYIFNRTDRSFEKFELFECGFFTVNKVNLSFPINIISLVCFIVLYELEFIISIPFFFNILNSFFFFKTVFFLLVFLIFLTIFMDVFFKSIFWLY